MARSLGGASNSANADSAVESSELLHAETPSPTRTIKVIAAVAVLFLPMEFRRRSTPFGSADVSIGV
jgi:hypothetical protein